MPIDSNTGAGRLKAKVWKKQRSTNDSDGIRCPETTAMPEVYRQNLRVLFNQIENEFEKLFTENLHLQEKVDLLSMRLEQGGGGGGGGSLDKPESNNDQIDGATMKTAKKSGSQISQKIKSTYKTSTSRLANTFKSGINQSGCAQFVRPFASHTDGVWEVNMSQHGPRVIGTASADYTAKLWCIESGAVLLQYYGHRGSVNSIRFHPCSDLVLTASGDQTAHIWKASVSYNNPPSDNGNRKSSSEDDMDSDGAELRNGDVSNSHFIHAPLQSLSDHTNVVVAADWLCRGDKVISGSWDGSAIVFDSETGETLNSLLGHESELTNVVCHPHQPLVLTSSKDSSVRLWDVRDHAVKVNAFVGHAASVTSAVFGGTDKIVSGSDDRTVKCWDMRNMTSPYVTIRCDSAVNRLSVSQNGTIAVPHDNRHVRFYDLNGTRVGRLPRSNRVGHTRMVCSTAWNDESSSQCNLFTAGFEKHVLGWQINFRSLDTKDKKMSS